MTVTVQNYNAQLGETEAGIQRREDVDITQDNDFVNKWSAYLSLYMKAVAHSCDLFVEEIEAECPWYLEMRDLIAECPNTNPVGLGNSDTPINLDVVSTNAESTATTPKTSDLEVSEMDYVFSSDEEHQLTEGAEGPADSEEEVSDVPKAERSAAKNKKRTAPQPGTVAAGRIAVRKPSKKTKLDEFASIVSAEEATRQQDVAMQRQRLQSKIERAKLRAEHRKRADEKELRKEDIELHKYELCAKMKMAQLQHEHELRLAQLHGHQALPVPHGSHNPFDMTVDSSVSLGSFLPCTLASSSHASGSLAEWTVPSASESHGALDDAAEVSLAHSAD